MPEGDAHIYRSSEGLVGGVCAGIAQRFDLDAALVRLVAVVLALVSVGMFALVYVALWLILPAQPRQSSALDVNPSAFQSEVYEQVVNGVGARAQAGQAAAHAQAAAATAIPPVPPAAASAYYSSMPQAGFASFETAASSVRAEAPAAGQQGTGGSTKAVTTSLGIGLVTIAVGLIALTSVLGIFTFDVDAWVRHAGPFLLITVGLFIMGRASKSNILIVFSGFVLVLFMVVGLYFSLHEGPAELGTSLPFSPDTVWEWRRH